MVLVHMSLWACDANIGKKPYLGTYPASLWVVFFFFFFSGWSYLDLWTIWTLPSSVRNLRKVFPAHLQWGDLPILPVLSPFWTYPQLVPPLPLVTHAQQLRWAIRYSPAVMLESWKIHLPSNLLLNLIKGMELSPGGHFLCCLVFLSFENEGKYKC